MLLHINCCHLSLTCKKHDILHTLYADLYPVVWKSCVFNQSPTFSGRPIRKGCSVQRRHCVLFLHLCTFGDLVFWPFLCKSNNSFSLISRSTDKYTLEKIEGSVKNGQYRETGIIENTRHRTKTNKTNVCLLVWWGCYIMAVSFIGGGNRRTRRKPPTCRNSLTNFIMLYTSHWSRFIGDKHWLHR